MKHFSHTFDGIWHQPKQTTKKLLKHKVPEWHIWLGLFLFFVIVIGLQLVGIDPKSYLTSPSFWLEFVLFFVIFIGVFYLESYLLYLASKYLCKGKSKYKNARLAAAITHLPVVAWILGVWLLMYLPEVLSVLLILVWTVYILIVVFGILAAGLGLSSSWQSFGMVSIVKGLLLVLVLTLFYATNKDLVDQAIEEAFFYNPINTEQPHFVPEGWNEIYNLDELNDVREELTN